MTHVHIDPFSGVSGDMLLGAVVDAGIALEALAGPLATLPVQGFTLDLTGKRDPRVGGSKVDVVLDEDLPQPHRHLADVEAIIRGSQLPEPVQTKALAAFRRLAEAEGHVHGEPPENVHFHEVGAIDAIVDVCGVILGFHLLGATSVTCGPVPLGTGFARCAHGLIPVPVPATVRLLRGVPTIAAGGPNPTGELVTPTGAVLLRTLVGRFGPQPPMDLETIAYGLGTRDRGERPNAVRLLIGPRSDSEAQAVDVITTTLDDLDARLFGPLVERLLADGALEATLTPVFAKKGRPAIQVTVLAPPSPDVLALLQERLFRETTTLGLRWRREHRATLQRSFRTVDTDYGPITIKEGQLDGQVVTAQPEFDSCLAAADAHAVPVRVVLDAARAASQDPETTPGDE